MCWSTAPRWLQTSPVTAFQHPTLHRRQVVPGGEGLLVNIVRDNDRRFAVADAPLVKLDEVRKCPWMTPPAAFALLI